MSTKMEDIEDIYKRLYELSCQIKELIERELYSELGKYFSKKEILLAESDKIISALPEGTTASDKLKIIVDKYQVQERENIAALSKIKEDTRQELLNTGKNVRLVNAYRANRESIHGNILDFSE